MPAKPPDKQFQGAPLTALDGEAESATRIKRIALTWTHSLRFRLTAWYTLVLGLVFGVGGAGIYWATAHVVRRETDAYLSVEAHRIASAASEQGDNSEVGELREAFGTVQGGTLRSQALPGFVLFESIYGRAVDPSTSATVAVSPNLVRNPGLITTFDDALHRSRRRIVFAGSDEERMMRVLTQPIEIAGRPILLQLAVPWDQNEDALQRLRIFLCLCIPLILAVTALGSWVVVGRTLQPIGRIVADVEAADIRSLSGALLPAPAETDSEVGRLVSTLNGMAARMHRAFDTQRRFAADASHELRTPLTFLRGEIEYTLLRPRDAETYRLALENAVTAIDDLGRIVESLSYLARLDSGESPTQRPPTLVEVHAVLAALFDEYRPEASRKSIGVTLNSAPACVRGDEEQIRLMLRNLIDNAVKYTPEGGSVTGTVEVHDDEVAVTVADTGIGIAADETERVFERFWRGEKSRTAAPSGTGLGLSIAAQLAEAQGGSITLRSTPGAGSTFTVRLPAVKT